jgi:hypothetical protein
MGGHPMAIDIFLFVDCIGLVFLIYALVNFWNEWRGYNGGRQSPIQTQLNEKKLRDRIAVIPKIFLYPKNQNSVIPFPAHYPQINFSPEHLSRIAKTIEMRRRVVSEPRASQGCK